MTDDAELLRRYVDSRTEIDFTTLVERHLNLVYQAALRRMGGRSDLAQDVTQQVFTTLAREAPKLVTHPALVGWLFTATRHAASQQLRAERRRQDREIQSLVRNSLESSTPDTNWDQIRDQLDEVMDRLAEQDRTAILQRFFHNQAFAQIGVTFGLSEDAARKRVDRALERLRGLLVKRGITSTGSALGVLLASQAATAAPAGLAQMIASTAFIPGATASLPTAGLLYFMNTKIALSLAGALGLAGVLSLPFIGLALYENHEATNAELAVTTARQENERRATELNKLQEQEREAEKKTAAFKLEQERAQAVAAALVQTRSAAQPALTQPEVEALHEGREFFALFPKAGPLVLKLSRAQIHSNYLGFYRSANLTPAQIAELEKQTSEYLLENQGVTPGGISPVVSSLPDDRLQQILGEENFQRLQEFLRQRPAYTTTRWAAMCAGFDSTPLSQKQTDQLVQTITANSSEYQSGQSLKLENVDWNAVRQQTEVFLTPDQVKAVQPALLEAQFQNALVKAQQDAATSTNQPNLAQ
jgi:RNA polymerase sigma factor (sigma-70 family)